MIITYGYKDHSIQYEMAILETIKTMYRKSCLVALNVQTIAVFDRSWTNAHNKWIH